MRGVGVGLNKKKIEWSLLFGLCTVIWAPAPSHINTIHDKLVLPHY